MDGEKWMTTKQAAQIIGTSTRVVRMLIRAGHLPAMRMYDHGHWRIPATAVHYLVEKRDRIIAEWLEWRDGHGVNSSR